MEKTITFKGIPVFYDDSGEGTALVLLHGYLESGPIWKEFAARFNHRCRVIIPDLPGHGRSGVWGREHSMDDLAGAVKAILDREEVGRAFVAGHSMGGYVTMAFADLYPERLLGYGLIHSTCFSDNDEKKKNRDREISLILCNKKHQIVNVNIPKGFATSNTAKFSSRISQAKELAMGCPDDGIVALLNGMKERPDRTHVLKEPRVPVLLVGGEKDNYIPVEVFRKLVELAPYADHILLPESGHMGFVEEAGAVEEALTGMLEKVEKKKARRGMTS